MFPLYVDSHKKIYSQVKTAGKAETKMLNKAEIKCHEAPKKQRENQLMTACL